MSLPARAAWLTWLLVLADARSSSSDWLLSQSGHPAFASPRFLAQPQKPRLLWAGAADEQLARQHGRTRSFAGEGSAAVPSSDDGSAGVARVGAAVGGGAAALYLGVPQLLSLVQEATFRSPIHKMVFFLFLSCTILWFLNPSSLAERTERAIRPAALRAASRGRRRQASLLFAGGSLCATAVKFAQVYFAAALVVSAVPEKIAKLIAPGLSASASVLTGNGAAGFMGPFMAPLLSVGAFTLQVLGVVLGRRSGSLFLAFLGPQLARFALSATAPSPRKAGSGGGIAALFGEVLRTGLAAGTLVATLACGSAAVDRALPVSLPLQIAVSAAAASPLLRDLVFAALGRKKVGRTVCGHVGGVFISGRLSGFSGRLAKIDVADGSTVTIGAYAAYELLQEDRTGGEVDVPVAVLPAALEAAQKAMQGPKKKIKPLPKVIAAVAAAAAAAFCWRRPELAFSTLFPLGVTLYMGKFILPRPLVMVVAAVGILSSGPINSTASAAVALGFLLTALVSPHEAPGPLAVCTGVDVQKAVARVSWRSKTKVDDMASVLNSVTEETSKAVAAKTEKKHLAQGVLAVLMFVLFAGFQPTVGWVESMTVALPTQRFFVMAGAAAVTLRLMLAGICPQGFRELCDGQLLPTRLGAVCGPPASAVAWSLAVNSRAALAGAMLGWVLPMQGWLQGFIFKMHLIHQVHWIDAWILRLSQGLLLLVLTVQGWKLVQSLLPQRFSSGSDAAAYGLLSGGVSAAAAAAVMRIVPSAISAAPPAPAVVSAITLAAAVVGTGVPLAKDTLARTYFAVLGAPRRDSSVWVRRNAVGLPTEAAVRARLARFEGGNAVLAARGMEFTVGAGELLGATYSGSRYVGATVDVDVEDTAAAGKIVAAVKDELRRHGQLLQRPPFAPDAVLDPVGCVRINAFVKSAVSAHEAWSIRSSLLQAAARAVPTAKAAETA
eukprot:TRINITY_DN36263_c0_g1_i1.p1 TRINITY_DN36263_c0_g1~~TRINITY_DN36263_c0_g1_i1.p1  ORF type:complete len:949 (+),score=189.92 TRINITY_DN36263_c0_g1_i1:52-2898(+)